VSAGTDAGDESGPPGALPVVLLVHGQPGAGADFSALEGLLSPSHRVLAPDRPGWGSNSRQACGMAANADALAEMLAEAAIQEPVTVVGHSFGGGVALELALNHPERVSALVLLGSVGVGEALSGFDRLLAVPMLGSGILRAGTATVRRAFVRARRYSKSHPGGRVGEMLPDLPSVRAAIGADFGPIVGRSRQSFLVEQRAMFAETPELERSLLRIGVPTAVVSGEADHVVPVTAARSLVARVPGAELVIMPGGHFLPFDHPEQVAVVVRRYAALPPHLKGERPQRGTPGA
jgi:pimeloyl-ACP methyl ester carboxylesterase